MILTCEQCRTSYRLDDNRLRPGGSTVRCSNCRNMWTAFPDGLSDADAGPAPDAGAGPVLAAAVAGVAAAGAATPQKARDTAETGEEPLRFTFELPADEAPAAPGGGRDAAVEDTAMGEEDFLTDELNLDDLEMILEAGEDDTEPLGAEEDLAFGGPGEDGGLADLGDGFKTEELDLADLEQMLARKSAAVDDAGDEEAEEAEELDLSLDAEPPAAEGPEADAEEDLQLDFSELDALENPEPAAAPPASGRGKPTPSGSDAEEDLGLELAPELKDLFDGLDDGPSVAIEETAELDLAGLEEGPTEAREVEAPPAPEEPVLKLEIAEELEELLPEIEAPEPAVEATEDLELDLFGEGPGQEAKAEKEEEEEITDIDLDFEALAEEPEAAEGPEDELLDFDRLLSGEASTPPAGVEEVEELDLGALEPDLAAPGKDQAPIRETPAELALDLELGETTPEELELDLDLGEAAPDELELDLDLDAAGPAAAAAPEEATAAEDAETAEADQTRELDIADLEAMLKLETPAPAPEASEEIDLDFDALTNEARAEAGAEDRTRELDLTDREKLLAGAETGAGSRRAPGPAVGVEEAREAARPKADEGQMLDLSDLEKMLSLEDTTDSEAPEAAAPPELDLELGSPAPAPEAAAAFEDLELEFDMPIDEPDESSILFDTSESEDLELEFDLGGGAEGPGTEEGELEFEILDEGDGGSTGDPLDAAARATTVTLDQVGRPSSGRAGDITKELVAEVAAAEAAAGAAAGSRPATVRSPFPRAKRRTTSPLLVVLLILVLLGGGVYALVQFAGIQIPYVSEWLGAKAGGAVVPVEASLKGYFVNNAKAGTLYVVEGQVRNDFPAPRSSIRVTGKIFANGKQFQRSASAYCGNAMTPEELQGLELAEITRRMNNRSGTNNSNLRVPPGKSVPFAVVFANLPPEVKLEEFAVEVAGSFPGDQQ